MKGYQARYFNQLHAIVFQLKKLSMIDRIKSLRFALDIVPFVPTLMLYVCFVRKRSVKLIETSLLRRERNVPSISTSTAPPKSGQPSASFEADAPPSKRKKDNKVRPGHGRHRPETKAKIDLFNKIRSSEKSSSEIKRSPEEYKLWEVIKTGKSLSNVFNEL